MFNVWIHFCFKISSRYCCSHACNHGQTMGMSGTEGEAVLRHVMRKMRSCTAGKASLWWDVTHLRIFPRLRLVLALRLVFCKLDSFTKIKTDLILRHRAIFVLLWSLCRLSYFFVVYHFEVSLYDFVIILHLLVAVFLSLYFSVVLLLCGCVVSFSGCFASLWYFCDISGIV